MPVDLSSIKKTDLGALIAGALAVVLSVFPSFITLDYDGAGGLGSLDLDAGITAWHGVGALAMLMILVATALVAVKVIAPQALPKGVPFNLVAAALAGVGTLILVLRVLTSLESQELVGTTYSVGPGWSGILVLLATLGLTACAALGFKESGEALPWQSQGGASTGGHAGVSGTRQEATGGYAAAGSGDPAAPQPKAPQPSVEPTTPPPGAPMPPPSAGAPMSQPPQTPAPGTRAPGAPGSGHVPPTGEERHRSY